MKQHRQHEMAGIAFQVIRDLISRRIPFRVARHGESWKRTVGAGREQHERIVALAPALPEAPVALYQLQAQWRLLQMVSHRQTCLPGSDNEYVQCLIVYRHRSIPFSCTW